MAEQETERALTPLQQWQALFQAFTASGYSHMNAAEAVERVSPGLWQAAAAEVARLTRAGALPEAPYKG